MDFSKTELELIVEALNRAAGRHESEARFNPRSAKPHDLKARSMRALATRISKLALVAATLALLLLPIKPASADTNTHASKNYTKLARLCRTVCSKPAPGSGQTECNTFCY